VSALGARGLGPFAALAAALLVAALLGLGLFAPVRGRSRPLPRATRFLGLDEPFPSGAPKP
jgi:hypothetical protein